MASSSSDRRAAVDKIRRDAQRADQRQGRIIITVAVMIALLIVGGVAAPILINKWQMRSLTKLDISDIGAAASVCGERILKPAEGEQNHVPEGTPVTYTDAPPAFGQHEQVWDEITRKLYTEKDRPNVEKLVHNLEHGYTVVWYDETVAADEEQMDQLRAIADKFKGEDDYRDKVKIVPWTEEDGKAFPKGKHVAITHWAKEAAEDDAKLAEAAKVTEQAGVWSYCSKVSGDALKKFMVAYPYLNSPEPNGG